MATHLSGIHTVWIITGISIWEPPLVWLSPVAFIGSALGSIPVLLVLFFALIKIELRDTTAEKKMAALHAVNFGCTMVYGIIGGALPLGLFIPQYDYWSNFLLTAMIITAGLFICSAVAIYILRNRIWTFFNSSTSNQITNMQFPNTPEPYAAHPNGQGSNKTFIKGLITGGLILLMLIPTVFITNLVSERQARQKEITREVSSKWASAQTLSGPFIFLPYTINKTDISGKVIEKVQKQVWILPDDLQVTGNIEHELRLRSIYKVLLYRAALTSNGNFHFQIPKDIELNSIQWQDVRICYSLSDFKGIEDRMTIHFNGAGYEMEPGLPGDEGMKGLSAPVALTAADTGKTIPFQLNTRIKGSEDLQFIPFAGNSSFVLQSTWNSPSFNGNALPTERVITDSGFKARWSFSKANLPFSTVLNGLHEDYKSTAFGVTLVQPADGYAKTNRCIKYAILFIGLTFSLFFIIELMQKKPLHPVQYVLIGLALVIFYTLLLAVSEFILFDSAYAIAAAATILLITLYSKSHFQSWRSAAIFGSVLTVLYGFIFVLIRLEDTALLVGSIGLFLVLALVMFASRKINWYGTKPNPVGLEQT